MTVPAHLWLMILCLISGNEHHVRRTNAGLKKQGDILGGGHRSVPAHAYLKDIGPNCRGRLPSPSPRRLPNKAGRIPEDAHHVHQPDAYQNKKGDVLGDGTCNRTVPTHLWLIILCLISGDVYHVRRAHAGLKKQGDILGGGYRSAPANAYLKDIGPNCRGRVPCPSPRRLPQQSRENSRGLTLCPSIRRITKQAGRSSGRQTQVALCTRLALHLGPNS